MTGFAGSSSDEIEMMVLGCMLKTQDYLNSGCKHLKNNDFHLNKHKIIFDALHTLWKEKKQVLIQSISQFLERLGNLDEIGGAEYLLTLALVGGTSTHFEWYVDQLIEIASKRKVQDIFRNYINASSEELLLIIEQQLKGSLERKNYVGSIYQYLLNSTSEEDVIKEIQNTSPSIDVGLRIGELDLKMPGGQVSIVAAPTSHGKTSFLINIALGAINKNDEKSVYYFSYEESMSSIITLFLNTFTDQNLSRNNRQSIESYFREGILDYISEPIREKFLLKKQEFFDSLIRKQRLNIFYSDMSVEQLIQALHFLRKNRKDIGLICIDYMQLLRSAHATKLSRQEELKQICLMLKDCSISTGFPIVLAAQFNRQVLAEVDLSPTNIGEAGDIERVASLILGFWNRNFLGFSKEGNKMKTGEIIKEPKSEIYLEVLKGRKIGNNHQDVLSFNGNTGKIQNQVVVC